MLACLQACMLVKHVVAAGFISRVKAIFINLFAVL